ncbi:reverse transcriptase domain-containing protein [Tanacetum coccineum]
MTIIIRKGRENNSIVKILEELAVPTCFFFLINSASPSASVAKVPSASALQCDNHDLSRFDNQSIERYRLIGIGFVLDFMEFTFSEKEMILVIEANRVEVAWVKTFGKEVEEYVTKVIAKDDLMENEQVYAKTGFAPHRIPQSEGNHNGWLSEEEESDSDSESTTRVSTCVEGGIYNYGGQHNYTCATTQVDLQKMPPRRATGEDENPPDITTFLAQQLQNLLPEIVNQVTVSVNANANNGNGNGANGGMVEMRMETVIDNSSCAENQKVRYVASSLVNKALTWWNTQVQARGREAANAMSWNDFKALLVEEFCPSNEMERLENEFWNHKMIGANHAGYTDRFHELAKLVPHLVTPESARIKRYMAGLAPEIRGMLKATQPATIQSAILKAGILTDKAVSNGMLTKGSEKRNSVDKPAKVGGSGRDVKKAKGGTNFVVATPSREGYAGSQPWCAKCRTHYNTPCFRSLYDDN